MRTAAGFREGCWGNQAAGAWEGDSGSLPSACWAGQGHSIPKPLFEAGGRNSGKYQTALCLREKLKCRQVTETDGHA